MLYNGNMHGKSKYSAMFIDFIEWYFVFHLLWSRCCFHRRQRLRFLLIPWEKTRLRHLATGGVSYLKKYAIQHRNRAERHVHGRKGPSYHGLLCACPATRFAPPGTHLRRASHLASPALGPTFGPLGLAGSLMLFFYHPCIL